MRTINLLGLPFDGKSSFMKGTAEAPKYIRENLHNGSSNYMTESGINILEDVQFTDMGDLKISDYHKIADQINDIMDLKSPGIFLGGDHSLTFPIVKALNVIHGQFEILHFDAHPDLYDEYEGDKYSHACPFARIMEQKLASRLVSVGIRNLSPHLAQQAAKFDVEIIMMNELDNLSKIKFEKPLYISIDMDVFDPAFAPGVSHHEPGGLSSREVINYLQSIKAKLIGGDIVELNPGRDLGGITTALSVKMLKELIGLAAI